MSCPCGVEGFASRLVDSLVRVRAEEVPLSLGQIRWQPLAAIGVVVRQGSGEGRAGDARVDGELDYFPKRCLALADVGGEAWVDQERGEGRVFVEGLLDTVKELGADDAPSLPYASNLSEVEAPLETFTGFLDQGHPLRVAADLGGVHGVADLGDQLLLVGVELLRLGSREDLGRLFALVEETAQVAPIQRCGDDAEGHGLLGALLHGPSPGSLHAGFVEDLVHDVCLAVVALLLHDEGRDLDQERLELALVPFVEDVAQLLVVEPSQVLHEVVRLAD
mmetsp:Transcript_21593/g.41952  ORF Transcript_21593/g.41952 Transcript_21593/m.41952 type:complete len:278 (-) Transcript_21593:736-1569(-)